MKDLSEACTEIENSLPLWVGGDLEPAAQKEVEEHLGRCSRCAEKAAATRLSRTRLLEGLDLESRAIGEGPDPWPAIRAALRSEGRLAGSRARPTEMRRVFPLRTAAAAAVLLGLVFVWERLAPVSPSGSPSNVGAVSKFPPSPVTAPVLTSSGSTSSAPIAAQPAGLHHLQPGEHLLRDSAIFYTTEDPVTGRSRFESSPVGLERPLSVPPR
jgi:anti-sigma factor RsiW